MNSKNFLKRIFAAAAILIVISATSSCKKDEEAAREKFLGTYSVTVGTITCDVSGNSSLSNGTSVIISENSGGPEKVSVSIGGQFNLIATANGNTLVLDNQTLNGFTYTGSGNLNGAIISLTINEADPFTPENCVLAITANK